MQTGSDAVWEMIVKRTMQRMTLPDGAVKSQLKMMQLTMMAAWKIT